MQVNRTGILVGRSMGLIGAVVLSLSTTVVGHAQAAETDALANAKNLPPTLISPDERKISQTAIDWRVKLLTAVRDSYRNSREVINMERAEINAEIEKLQASLPVEFRFFTNAESRAQLVGRVLQMILETRLEITTRESMLASLEKAKPPENEGAAGVLLADLEVASYKLSEAKSVYAEAVEMRDQGRKSNSDLSPLKANIAVAKLNVQKLQTAYAVARRKPKVEAAERLADVRLEIQPLRAKLEAAEEFLYQFNNAAGQLQKIESLRQEQELKAKDLANVASEMSGVSRELVELELLSELIEDAGPKADKQQEEK